LLTGLGQRLGWENVGQNPKGVGICGSSQFGVIDMKVKSWKGGVPMTGRERKCGKITKMGLVGEVCVGPDPGSREGRGRLGGGVAHH